MKLAELLTPLTRRQRGNKGEDIALNLLQKSGLTLVTRNFLCKVGELDLVMQDGDTLVFIEVRVRSSDRFGDAISTIGHTKQKRVIAAAQVFLQQHAKYARCPCRFDVVGITGNSAPEWLRAAFDCTGF